MMRCGVLVESWDIHSILEVVLLQSIGLTRLYRLVILCAGSTNLVRIMRCSGLLGLFDLVCLRNDFVESMEDLALNEMLASRVS